MKRPLKNTFQSIGISIFTLLIVFFILEVGLRIFYRSSAFEKSDNQNNRKEDLRPRYIYEGNKYFGYKFKPNLKTEFKNILTTKLITNSLGFRDKDYNEKEKGVIRIVFIGDSFTFGWDVENDMSFPKQLEKILNERIHGKKFEVINCGIPGYGTDQELELLRSIISIYEPDIVLVGFYTGNDVTDNIIGGVKRRSIKDGYLLDNYLHEKVNKDTMIKKIGDYLSSKSILFSIVKDRCEKLALRLGYHSEVNPYYQLEIKQLDIFKNKYDRQTEKGIQKTEKLIKEISQVSSAGKAKMGVILIPAFYQVYSEAWGKYFYSYGLNISEYDKEKPNKILEGFFKRNRIKYMDLLENFRNSGKTENLYLFGHWNKKGHLLAANWIYGFLEKYFLNLNSE